MYINELRVNGGARIGLARASWPFANLKVSSNRLELNAFIIGNLVFSPIDVISIEINPAMALIGNAIKINHTVKDYSANIIFMTFENPESLISRIRATGFLNKSHNSSAQLTEILSRQQSGGFPIKIPVAIGLIIIWNLLFLSDFIRDQKNDLALPFGNGALMALAFALVTSILMLSIKKFGNLMMKDGRSIKEIDRFLYLVIFITGLILTGSVFFRFFI
ncbi:hypothetical protein [Pedobacter sp.]|uniref:hypothetical protein n=1 Tax=Pedobacter sp. TaxID=1411316 RepID=UPI003BA87015